jgi:hypothetical protein
MPWKDLLVFLTVLVAAFIKIKNRLSGCYSGTGGLVISQELYFIKPVFMIFFI